MSETADGIDQLPRNDAELYKHFDLVNRYDEATLTLLWIRAQPTAEAVPPDAEHAARESCSCAAGIAVVCLKNLAAWCRLDSTPESDALAGRIDGLECAISQAKAQGEFEPICDVWQLLRGELVFVELARQNRRTDTRDAPAEPSGRSSGINLERCEKLVMDFIRQVRAASNACNLLQALRRHGAIPQQVADAASGAISSLARLAVDVHVLYGDRGEFARRLVLDFASLIEKTVKLGILRDEGQYATDWSKISSALLELELPRGKTRSKSSNKSGTNRGDGKAKLIAALTTHHKYADGGCLNLEPIGNNELARLAGVSQSTATAFFSDKFKGLTGYKTACKDKNKLIAALKLLNDEFSPHLLLGSPSQTADDREED